MAALVMGLGELASRDLTLVAELYEAVNDYSSSNEAWAPFSRCLVTIVQCRYDVLVWNLIQVLRSNRFYTPPPQVKTTYTTPPSTASHPNSLTAKPPWPRAPTISPNPASFLPLIQFATTNPLATYRHLLTSPFRSFIRPECGNSRINRSAKSIVLNKEWFRSEGCARSRRLSSALGKCSDAIGFLADPAGGGEVEVGDEGWISGADKWSCIIKRQTVKLIGRICERRMNVRILAASYLRSEAAMH